MARGEGDYCPCKRCIRAYSSIFALYPEKAAYKSGGGPSPDTDSACDLNLDHRLM